MRRTERPVQTRFRCAYTYRFKLARHTKSLTHYTKGTWSPFQAPTVCRQSVSGTLSLPLSGCFSPYWFAIGHARVLRLGRWSSQFQTGFHVSRLTRGYRLALRIRGCHPLWPYFPEGFACLTNVAGLVRVRSPLLAESRLMSFPTGT